MSDGAHRFEADEDAREGRDGYDEPVTADEMTAKLAADFGIDPAVLARECEMYAWHFAEIIACHRRFDRFKGRPYGDEYRRHAAELILNDGRAGVPDQ